MRISSFGSCKTVRLSGKRSNVLMLQVYQHSFPAGKMLASESGSSTLPVYSAAKAALLSGDLDDEGLFSTISKEEPRVTAAL